MLINPSASVAGCIETINDRGNCSNVRRLSESEVEVIRKTWPRGEYGSPIEAALHDVVKKGFLLHGSPIALTGDWLMPGLSMCLGTRRSVYATKRADNALYYATFGFRHWRINNLTHFRRRVNGWIYVLDSRFFIRDGVMDDSIGWLGSEYLRDDPVKPILIIPVQPKDLPDEHFLQLVSKLTRPPYCATVDHLGKRFDEDEELRYDPMR